MGQRNEPLNEPAKQLEFMWLTWRGIKPKLMANIRWAHKSDNSASKFMNCKCKEEIKGRQSL